MEGQGLKRRRRTSALRKSQMVVGGVAFAVTLLLQILEALNVPNLPVSQSSALFKLGFTVGFVLMLPGMLVGGMLGISQTGGPLIWGLVELVTNTVLGLAIGTVIGLLLLKVAAPQPRSNTDSSATERRE